MNTHPFRLTSFLTGTFVVLATFSGTLQNATALGDAETKAYIAIAANSGDETIIRTNALKQLAPSIRERPEVKHLFLQLMTDTDSDYSVSLTALEALQQHLKLPDVRDAFTEQSELVDGKLQEEAARALLAHGAKNPTEAGAAEMLLAQINAEITDDSFQAAFEGLSASKDSSIQSKLAQSVALFLANAVEEHIEQRTLHVARYARPEERDPLNAFSNVVPSFPRCQCSEK